MFPSPIINIGNYVATFLILMLTIKNVELKLFHEIDSTNIQALKLLNSKNKCDPTWFRQLSRRMVEEGIIYFWVSEKKFILQLY